MKTKQTLRIVLSYPGDVKAERLVMEDVVKEVNGGIAVDRNLVLELHSWDTDAYPGFHPEGPQGLIDPILKIEDCDVLLGIFWKRFGTPTKKALSGTEHEIRTAIEAHRKRGCPQIMVYFKEAEYIAQSEEELEQLKRVLRFKSDFPKEGLYWTFKDVLEFERKARIHLSNFIRATYDLVDTQMSKAGVHNAVRDYCLNVRQRFANIHLFGEKRRDEPADPTALERMSSMDQGFVPLHLRDWREEGEDGNGEPLDIDELFLTGWPDSQYLVRGLPGGGKTTLLRYLAHRMASLTIEGSGEWIPVYIRLRQYDCLKDNTLEDLVRKDINKQCDSLEMCDALFKRERFLERPMVLLLDGLDEIEGEVTSDKIAELLDDLARDKPRCKIIVTGRPIGLKRLDFPHYRPLDLQPLNEEMVGDYLARWFGSATEKISRLQKTLKNKPRIFTLATTPFLLSMICYTFEQGGATELIERRSQLYENCTRYLIKRSYDLEDQNREPIDLEATLNTLKEISLRFFLWQEADFDVNHLSVMVQRLPAAETLGSSEEVLRRVERETGLIQRGQEGFTFVHRSLWEYFTALALLDKKDPKFVIRQAANPEWEEVVRLYAGLLEDREREQNLVNRLWTINRPLALRVTTETRTPAAELLAPLITGEDNRGKLLLISALEQSLDLVPEGERSNLVQETLRILLIECREKDCEVIFHAQALLEKERLHPLDGKRGGLIYELLDLEQAATRQEELLSDPANHFEWIEIKGGTFQMGDDQHGDSEKPTHPVQVDTFLMAKHPVTNRLLESFPLGEKYPNYGGEHHPAVGNTWFEAYYFALWVGARLPSEAEWEYAARGGCKARLWQYFFGDDPEDLADHAWFGESGRDTAHAVNEVNPRTEKENLNPLGLANMLGNVWEWTADDWHSDYEDAPSDSRSWINTPRGTYRVVRGGGWDVVAHSCRSAARNYNAPGGRSSVIGFRLARSLTLGP